MPTFHDFGGGDGAEVIYALRNSDTLAKSIINNLAASGQQVRKYYQRRLPSNPVKDYYFVIRDTPNNQTMLVEYGFLDNAEDAARLKSNYEKYAEAVVKSLADYGGYKYVPKANANEYVVQKGDTLWSIARKFNISVDELKKLNNINNNSLSIGQVLTIKNANNMANTSDEYYTVQKGDSLYSIANKYNTSVDALKKLNNLSTNNLSVGQKLLLKDNNLQGNTNEYTVQKGDSLYSIANKYNTSVDILKKLNNLSTNNLSVGQKLLLPANTNDIYIVEKGDSLYSIAKKLNTTVDKLINTNSLSTTNLSIGQKLVIPK